MGERFVCVHGHFYQPPREQPWLEEVERQPSAYPFHDWNARITAECYEPNTAARVLDEDGRILRLVNNYARISFNVGPTLLRWMQVQAPTTYAAIIEADRRSRSWHGGHGSAMAQSYHHAILPLANERDRRTEVAWGIADFRARFGRDPEGMWCAEAAVDLATLDELAAQGIAFTVLSPYQASRVRDDGDGDAWTDVSDGTVDTTVPYRVQLPSGRDIAVFFYDGERSRAVAFEGLLDSGAALADRLLGGFADDDGPQLVHIATDGESYGHHHRHGEMALAFALRRLEETDGISLINYGAFLERFPPTREAEIVAPSSWSCSHGVERWRSDCGCTTGGRPGWDQAWRAGLRAALDELRDELAPRYAREATRTLRDPWAARDEYVRVVLDRSGSAIEAFLADHASRPLTAVERTRTLQLLELQRHALMMFTSCGWFFEELARIETVQVLLYAARALQLSRDLFDDAAHLEEQFLTALQSAPSNRPDISDGRDVYERLVAPSVVSVRQMAAHAAISGLFERGPRRGRVYVYEVARHDTVRSEAGRARLAVGRLEVRSTVTGARGEFDVGVVHLGDHNVTCGLREPGDDLELVQSELLAAFEKADLPAVIRRLDKAFDAPTYALESLVGDEQDRILELILDTTVAEAEATLRTVYRSRAPLMRYLSELGVELPPPLQRAAEVVLNAQLRDAVRDDDVDPQEVEVTVAEAQRYGVELDAEGIALALNGTIERVVARISGQIERHTLFDAFGPLEERFFSQVNGLVGLTERLPFEVSLWHAQNLYYRVRRDVLDELTARAQHGDGAAARWVHELTELGHRLGFA